MTLQEIYKTRPLFSSRSELVAVCGVLFFFFGLALNFYYERVSPSEPDPSAGRIYDLDDHGNHVYVTAQQHYLVDGLIIGGWLIGLPAAVFETLARMRSARAR